MLTDVSSMNALDKCPAIAEIERVAQITRCAISFSVAVTKTKLIFVRGSNLTRRCLKYSDADYTARTYILCTHLIVPPNKLQVIKLA